MTIYDEIQAAREAAHAKHGAQSIEGIVPKDSRWLSILVEEVGEVAHELTYDATGDLRKELIQVAAVAAAWVDAIDRDAAHRDVCGHLICPVCRDEFACCTHEWPKDVPR